MVGRMERAPLCSHMAVRMLMCRVQRCQPVPGRASRLRVLCPTGLAVQTRTLGVLETLIANTWPQRKALCLFVEPCCLLASPSTLLFFDANASIPGCLGPWLAAGGIGFQVTILVCMQLGCCPFACLGRACVEPPQTVPNLPSSVPDEL
jgi:hypothetical protein